MTPPDYREQASKLKDTDCPHGPPGEFYMQNECTICLASWASRIAEEERRRMDHVLDLADQVTEIAYPENQEWYASAEIVRAVTAYRRARVSGGEGR